MKINWKKNLVIVWIGCFFTGASTNLVMPFIPVYVEQLGTSKDQTELLSGLAISVIAFASVVIAPIWGNLADRKDRKLMMIRTAAGMTLAMGSLAFVSNVYWLLVMRSWNGVLSGYIPNVITMIAPQAPREKSGWALGILSTGAIAGNLTGPSMGGALVQWFGMENVFLITGALLMITTVSTISLVKEDFHPTEKKDLISTKGIFSKMGHLSILIGLFITTLTLQIGITTINPTLTLYIRELSGNIENILFVSGSVVLIAGASAVFSSPKLGRLGDKIGNQKVLVGGFILSFCCYLSMAFVTTPFQLGILRLTLGFSTDVLMPSVNTLISKAMPQEEVSRIYSYNQMFSNFRQVLRLTLGPTVAHAYNHSVVFTVISLFAPPNILLPLLNFREVLCSRL